jgi:hypothetical protein
VSDTTRVPEPLKEGFYVELKDGTQALVQFDDMDDLVFMLGDGVNQYINPGMHDNNGLKLRATPHAVVMPDQDNDEARVWYGRMVLPPPAAIHPEHGISFGDIRKGMIHGAMDDLEADSLSLGCSVQRRASEEESCTADEMMCWHRCQNISFHNVSEEICTNRGLQLACMNPRGQLTDGGHGDYFPGCAELDAVNATPYPRLPDYPRDNGTCTNIGFASFNYGRGFDHEFDLPHRFVPNGPGGGLLQWSVVGDEIHGRLAFNGIFGYLAIGFADLDGAKNGMHGATLIMALPGGNYSAVTGLDLSLGTQIDNYMISENKDQSSFRWWQTPIATTRSLTGSASVETNDCYTALYFNTSTIAGRALNVTGGDEMIWGANGEDYFAGYHSGSAARFHIEWTAGTGAMFVEPTSAPTLSSQVAPPVGAPTASAPTAAAPTATAPTAAAPTSSSVILAFPSVVTSVILGLTIICV